MKIIAHIRYVNEVGGAESFIRDMLEQKEEVFSAKHVFILIGLQKNVMKYDCLQSAYHIYTISGLALAFRIRLIKLLWLINPDFVISHGVPPITLSLIAIFRKRRPIMFDHGTFNIPASTLFKKVKSSILKVEVKWFTSMIITNSEYSKKIIMYWIGEKKIIMIAYLGISLSQKNITKPSTSGVIGYLGRISFDDKGTDMLVALASELLSRNINFKILVAGDGPDLGALKQLVYQKGLIGKFSFEGNITDKHKFISSLNCMVSTSKTETFGLSIVESIYFGVPVCAFDVGALSEIFGKYSVVKLVKPFDLDDAVNKITTIINSDPPPEDVKYAIRKDIEAKYSIIAFETRLIQILSKSIKNNF